MPDAIDIGDEWLEIRNVNCVAEAGRYIVSSLVTIFVRFFGI